MEDILVHLALGTGHSSIADLISPMTHRESVMYYYLELMRKDKSSHLENDFKLNER